MPSKPAKPDTPTTIAVSKPPARRKTLGDPPQTAADTASVGNNTQVAADDKLVDVAFKMDQAFRRNFRLFCASNDLTHVGAFREAMADYMKKKGWESSN